MHDSKALTDQCEYFTPPTQLQQELARKTVCSFAYSAADATELLKMLGLFPGEEANEHIADMTELRPVALR